MSGLPATRMISVMRVIRIGVIGLGVISRFYLPALTAHPASTVRAICDKNPDLATLAGPGTSFHQDYRTLLASDEVDAVVVNLPNHLHYPVCRAALAAGKHVCCEKPLTIEPDQASELEQLARRSGRILLTAFHRRYNRNVLGLRDRMAGRPAPRRTTIRYWERIEEHCGADTWYLDPRQCGGGCVIDNGPNALDTALFLLDDGPLRMVDARIRYGGRGVDQRAVLTLQAAAGGEVCVDLDWTYGGGELKTVEVEWAGGHTDQADMLAGFTEFKSSLYHEYVGVVDDFVGLISGRRDRPDTGRQVAELVAAAYRQGGADAA